MAKKLNKKNLKKVNGGYVSSGKDAKLIQELLVGAEEEKEYEQNFAVPDDKYKHFESYVPVGLISELKDIVLAKSKAPKK